MILPTGVDSRLFFDGPLAEGASFEGTSVVDNDRQVRFAHVSVLLMGRRDAWLSEGKRRKECESCSRSKHLN